jgi:hypothetical protein
MTGLHFLRCSIDYNSAVVLQINILGWGGRSMGNQGQSREQKEAVSAEELKQDHDAFIINLYKLDLFTEDEFSTFYNSVAYHGFDREKVLIQMRGRSNPKNLVKLIVVIALRGPQRAKIWADSLVEFKNLPTSSRGRDDLSFTKIAAATADIAAYYLKKANVTKRLTDHPCPAWLQFPSAGAIKMPAEIRVHHRSFCEAFSLVIGGKFNKAIYDAMVQNAYINDNYRLFD